jgi:VWFA-related protein
MRAFIALGLTTAALIASTTLDRSPLVDTAASAQVQDGGPQFSSRSELVVLNVTVRDKGNRYLDGLEQNAFTVFENGHAQPVRFFLHEDAPVTIGLLIDNSWTMHPIRDLVVAAAAAFADTSNPQDELFALAFNEEVHAALTADSPFTSDSAVLRSALQDAVTARGRTALYDGVARGLEYVERGQHERKVLVLVTDGSDNASLESFEHVLDRIHSSNVVVYAVAIVDPADASSMWKRMRAFADDSGGGLFHPNNVTQVNGVLQQIAQEIRHTYVMAYEPSTASADRSRKIRVQTRGPAGQTITVRRRAEAAPANGRDSRKDQAHVQ